MQLTWRSKELKFWKSPENRNIKICRSIDSFTKTVGLDKPALNDWKILTKIKTILKLFYKVIKWWKLNVTKRSYWAIWEILSRAEWLIKSLKAKKILLEYNINIRLFNIYCHLTLNELIKYMGNNSRSLIWFAALILYSKKVA